jgi:nicotinate-nucleotide pyrophosphorylase (carboxylating)
MKARPEFPPRRSWDALLSRALDEDVGSGDVTSALVFTASDSGDAQIEAREPMRVCGLDIACAVFDAIDPQLVVDRVCADGDDIGAGTPLLRLHGRLRSILTAERTALNFLGRLSGVATHTHRFVAAVAGSGVAIVDTRKTIPGWRVLDKYAVAVGGGTNHRMGLFDGVLLKDNHCAAAGSVAAAVARARALAPAQVRVQVEVESLADARAAVEAGADFLLLDNRTPDELREIASALRTRATLEASGGVTLANVRDIAATGVHRIAIGSLTHSAPNADVALELQPATRERAR